MITAEEMQASIDRVQELRTQQLRTYWSDPVGWVNTFVEFPEGESLADYQAKELTALAEQGRVAVRGPRGSGKTMPASLSFWWFATTREMAREDWKIASTAGSWPQLSVYLWPEIHKWRRRIRWDLLGIPAPKLGREMLTHQLKWSYGEGFGRATDDPELIEGAHATHMLVIIDEGKSVTDAIWDAVEGFFSNPGEHYAFALSTPGASVGRFYEIHSRKAGLEDWYPIHVTIEEAVAAGRVSQGWADQRLRQWGFESVSYQTHVLAEFGGEDDGVIPLAWIEAAIERGRQLKDKKRKPDRIGLDVADTGDDVTVMALRKGNHCYEIERIHSGDVLDHADKAANRAVEGTLILVDSIGVGAGTHAALKRNTKLKVEAFVASTRSKKKDRTKSFGFANRRAEAWWNLREMLDPDLGDNISLPDDSEMLGDLTAPKWREAAGGKIQIESKDDIRKRIGRSTDVGDAVVQVFAPSRSKQWRTA